MNYGYPKMKWISLNDFWISLNREYKSRPLFLFDYRYFDKSSTVTFLEHLN